jgi:raffinose/stachyose/melibiose transport system substrate-binding protein
MKQVIALVALLLVTFSTAQTLKEWDLSNRPAVSAVQEQLNAEFTEAHPGVTIERNAVSFDDLIATVSLALASNEPPDVAMVNQGAADMGEAVKAGLIMPLDDYAEKYGWLNLYSSKLLDRFRWSAEHKFGEGPLYGVANTAQFVAVYYNKAIFDQVGIGIPETFEDFQASLAQLKEAGITPIVYGNLEGWPGIHLYSAVQHLFTTTDELDTLIFNRGGTWNTEGNKEAAAIIQDWVGKGYLTEGFSGIGYDDSWSLFLQGQGAMMITGTWITGEFVGNPDIRFFLMPPLAVNAGTVPPHVAGTEVPFTISVKTPNPDLAADYINFMHSPRAAELWLKAGLIPTMKADESLLVPDTLVTDTYYAWQKLDEANAMGHYIDWSTPTFYDTVTSAIQELEGNKLDPQGFVEKLDADYQKHLSSKQ